MNDIVFFVENDPACKFLSTPLLFYKGFQGLAAYRSSNILWKAKRHTMALFIQNRSSEVFGVDIHPAAKIGGAVMIDHATGVVIGETCEIESGVSIFQGVTLGGKGFESGKRHPNIKKGASIFAASTILGDITIGEGAIVAAGSLVLKDVPEKTTVAGVPAKIIS
jgi:serine O-acetyltransferase